MVCTVTKLMVEALELLVFILPLGTKNGIITHYGGKGVIVLHFHAFVTLRLREDSSE